MLTLVVHVLTVGLIGAVSPVMLTEATVLLTGPTGVRRGLAYAVGTATVVLLFSGAVLLLGWQVALPEAPHLDASLDIVLGLMLVGVAAVVHLRRKRRSSSDSTATANSGRAAMSPGRAYGFGVFAMATNVTTLAVVLAGAKEIAARDVTTEMRLVAVLTLVVLICLPAWAPVALTAAAPHTAGLVLGRLSDFLRVHGRTVIVLALAGLGAFLLGRGLFELVME